jgi:polyisoprenoid-binding protein YceI
MKKFIYPALAAIVIATSAFKVSTSVNWQINEGYAIKFTGTDAEGVFTKMNGDLNFDESNLESSKFSVTIDVTSINTGNGMKNKHAKSDKWFDANQFPSITFTSGKFTKSATGYQVEGTLDMHGIKKQVAIPFTFSNNTFKGNFSVNRADYGVGSLEGMAKKVPNEIKLDITVPVTKK